jgi:endonuclease I
VQSWERAEVHYLDRPRVARFLAFLILFAAASLAAPPAGYYDAATGLTGEPLKQALHEIIDDHTVIPYADLLGPLRTLWEDPQDSSKITLIYGGAPVAKGALSWNREHLWPRSKGVNPGTQSEGGPDDSDLFHVVPADGDVNSARSNRYFDESAIADGSYADPAHPEAPLCTRDVNSWQPPPSERGEIARAMFYMAVRYDGNDAGTVDLELGTKNPGQNQMANLATLLAWHAADPPDAAERARNDRIYADHQHNRNPFIDHPEWVSAIWGPLTGATTAQVTASSQGAFEQPNVSTTFTVTLNENAPEGGLLLHYVASGTSTAADYGLSGSGVNSVAQTILIPAGAASTTVIVTPVSDGVVEGAETLRLTLAPDAAYDAIGGPATILISDDQSIPRGVLASWNFDVVPYPTSIPPSAGTATLSTAAWTGNVSNFAGVTGQSLALVGNAGNNSHIELSFSTLGWTNLQLTFQTRRNASGSFTAGTWSWSTNGTQFTNIAGQNTVATSEVFEPRGLDFSEIAALQNAPIVYLRYTLTGASNSSANNRVDDLTVTGSRYSTAWLTRFPALAGANAEPSADPDGDTLANLTEWAFDLDPLTTSGVPLTAFGIVIAPDPEDGNLPKSWPTVRFTRRTDTASLLLVPEQSQDLRAWTDDCVLVSAAAGPTPQSEVVVFRGTVPIGVANTFFRIRIRDN